MVNIGAVVRWVILHMGGNATWIIWQLRSRGLDWFTVTFEIVITLLGTFPNLEKDMKVYI